MPRRRRVRPVQHETGLSPRNSRPEQPQDSGAVTDSDSSHRLHTGLAAGYDDKRLCVKNLPQNVSFDDVFYIFSKFGQVKDVNLIRNRGNGQLRDFCFVTFKEKTGALRAMEASRAGTVRLGSRLIRAEPARPRLPPPAPAAEMDRCAEGEEPQRRARRRRGRGRCRRGAGGGGVCHMDRLPAELLEMILSLLPLRHQLTAEAVSRRWRAVVHGLLARTRDVQLGHEFADVAESASISSGQLGRLLQLTTGLQRLHTGPPALCPFETLDHITAHCPRLVSLDMSSGMFTCNYQRLWRLVRACPLLEDITLPTYYVCDESVVLLLLRHLRHLRRLEVLPGTALTGQSLALLPDSLRLLRLPFCGGIESVHVRHVSRCSQLLELDVSGVSRLLEDDLSAALAGCPRLEKLSAARLSLPPEDYLPPQGLPHLTLLDVHDSGGVCDVTLSRLPELAPALTALNIQGCDGVTEAGLRHVARLTRLESLDAGYLLDMSDAVLYLMRPLPLRELRLAQDHTGRARFSVDGVIALAVNCPSLGLLDLSCVEDALDELFFVRLEQGLSDDKRYISVYVGGTPLERYPWPAAARVRPLQYITVPGGRRRLTPEQMWKENDDEEVPTIGDWRRPPDALDQPPGV